MARIDGFSIVNVCGVLDDIDSARLNSTHLGRKLGGIPVEPWMMMMKTISTFDRVRGDSIATRRSG